MIRNTAQRVSAGWAERYMFSLGPSSGMTFCHCRGCLYGQTPRSFPRLVLSCYAQTWQGIPQFKMRAELCIIIPATFSDFQNVLFSLFQRFLFCFSFLFLFFVLPRVDESSGKRGKARRQGKSKQPSSASSKLIKFKYQRNPRILISGGSRTQDLIPNFREGHQNGKHQLVKMFDITRM